MLQLGFLDVYLWAEGKNVRVSDCFTRGSWNWTKILGKEVGQLQGVLPCISELKEMILRFTVEDRPDLLHWRWSTDGHFSIKSTYSALTDGGARDARCSKIWNLKVPLKVKVFSWLVLKKRVLTRDILCKRRW
ncbi:hypothetical protein ACMD2_23389 [Ananas comosus]|uniref:Reverse transcriptase zinc-binding domain-containing protein n=1 Tax=Ananas comosus TaxID=4615 RepID=A0A199W6L4_ANACO|nr:hypothetical protein ACMD2_23389 [Ananas comosus]